ncbi:MAG: RsmB/NOP family class I SAM-dependent RNA methyltransferase [Myxococcales bacterium]|nr:RsmB/NOP family class I SAM-dependent RNA methyltransferase [Myxococcales bacterium]
MARYAPIVDDLPAFLACAARPLPRVVIANPLKTDLASAEARVRARCPEAEPVPWRPGAWRLPPDARPGRWPEFIMGLLHAQEEATIWPGELMGAQPGERILDLCAAPGGKTALMAWGMADQGTLVANDREYGRLAALRRTLDRLGVTCAAVTQVDASRMPITDEPFYDRVLADVPCTCEGTTRKQKGGRKAATPERFRDTIVQVQKAILRRAVSLVKPGGTIVYATCTYAPEENEAVLSALPEGLVAVEPVQPPAGLAVTPGITEWAGEVFRPDAVNAARLWPHHNDTGGFFVAKLRRL